MRSIGGVGGALVVLAVILGLKFFNKSASGDEVLRKAHTIIQRCDAYDAHPEYLDGLVDWAHDDAFEASYEMRFGRRRASRFDEGLYFSELFSRIVARCREDKLDAIADSVAKVYNEEFGGRYGGDS